jgi:hypothetical protein
MNERWTAYQGERKWSFAGKLLDRLPISTFDRKIEPPKYQFFLKIIQCIRRSRTSPSKMKFKNWNSTPRICYDKLSLADRGDFF